MNITPLPDPDPNPNPNQVANLIDYLGRVKVADCDRVYGDATKANELLEQCVAAPP